MEAGSKRQSDAERHRTEKEKREGERETEKRDSKRQRGLVMNDCKRNR